MERLSRSYHRRHGFLSSAFLILLLAACSGGGSEGNGSSGLEPQHFQLTVSAAQQGGVVTSTPAGITCGNGASECSASYPAGTIVTLTAAASAGYGFYGWSGTGQNVCVGTGACAVNLSSNQTVTAGFSPVSDAATLDVVLQGLGTVVSTPSGISCGVDCRESFRIGDEVELTAIPATGYAFSGWSHPECPGVGTCYVTLVESSTITASFLRTSDDTHQLSVTINGNGTVVSLPAGISCGNDCTESYAAGSSVVLSANPADMHIFLGWEGAGCSGTGTCSVNLDQDRSIIASFADADGAFSQRPFLFKSDEARLKASIAAGDPEATGSSSNNRGQPLGFVTLMQRALDNRDNYEDVPTFHLALAGWLTNNGSMLELARDEAMSIVSESPAGDVGTGSNFQHVEERILDVAATADLAYEKFSPTQLAQVAAWVNGTLDNWNEKNLDFWPFDEPKNNYWQNGFLAHVIAGISTEGFNDRAGEWLSRSELMIFRWKQSTSSPIWIGPVQSEGHYYAGYVSNALWAMELYDSAVGTDYTGDSFSVAEQLDLLMYQTRPHLANFFEVGSEANRADAAHTGVALSFWYHLIHSGQATLQAKHAKDLLSIVESSPTTEWSRASKGFVNFYWNIRGVTSQSLATKMDRMYTAPTPGAGLIGLRSSAGFQTNARAAIMFANNFSVDPAFSHGNPDAPGFQWAHGDGWLVTDPEFFNNSGILAEAGGNVLSDVSNIVTLAGQKANNAGDYPVIRYSEDNSGLPVPHYYVQIDAQPYWNSASTYRRDYVWMDDLQVVIIFDKVVGAPAKKWRLHVPVSPTISGSVASYMVSGVTVSVRDLLPSESSPWSKENLKPATTTRDVWRLFQDDDRNDYTSLKVLDVGGRVTAASASVGAGYFQANLSINGVDRVVKFYSNGNHAEVM